MATWRLYGPFSSGDSLVSDSPFLLLVGPSQVDILGYGISLGEGYSWVIGMPDSRAAAATIGLKVEPGEKPLPPPIAVPTLRFSTPWFFEVSRPYGRVCAMARILPVPGSTMLPAADTGSVT